MFYTFKSSDFGIKLKNIRKLNRFTQEMVSLKISMSIESIRKIENGKVMPRFDTLVRLSQLYKTNLIQLMSDSFKMVDLTKLYLEAQEYIDHEEIESLENVKNEAMKIYQGGKHYDLVLLEELNQFNYFCEAALLFLRKDMNSLSLSKDMAILAIKATIPDFGFTNFQKFQYNLFEIRILHLIALIDRRSENYFGAIDLLEHLLNICENNKDLVDAKLVNQLLFSISYSYHEISDFKASLDYAEQGILFSVSSSRLNELHFHYYRKGIAEFHLGRDNYLESLKTSVYLLKAIGSPLAGRYKEITLNQYGIIIE